MTVLLDYNHKRVNQTEALITSLVGFIAQQCLHNTRRYNYLNRSPSRLVLSADASSQHQKGWLQVQQSVTIISLLQALLCNSHTHTHTHTKLNPHCCTYLIPCYRISTQQFTVIWLSSVQFNTLIFCHQWYQYTNKEHHWAFISNPSSSHTFKIYLSILY
jgi:hypothetical protein